MHTKELLTELTGRNPVLESCRPDIEKACKLLISLYLDHKGKLLVCGNGGSSSDADHIVGELMKSFEKKRVPGADLLENLVVAAPGRGKYIASKLQGALPAISLNAHSGLVSAISNDMDASLVFAQQVAGYGRKGDVLLAISTSGNSSNIIDAAITAKAMGLKVLGLTGKGGGKLKAYCDVLIDVPARHTPEVQELHLPVYHSICKVLEDNLF